LSDEPTQHAEFRGLQTGNREAWAKLHDDYSLEVWRYTARLVGGDAAAVADVVQETFLDAARSARSFNPQRGSKWQWLRGIAHHKVAAHWRQTARAARLQELAESRSIDLGRWLNDGRQVPHPAEELEMAELVRGILVELTADHAALLTAKYLDDHSLSEIAAQCGSTVEAIKSKLARARGEFRAKFEKFYPAESSAAKPAASKPSREVI
jgi:RNA polymerase sigma-70 factor (ECF subfamily)